MYHMDGFGKILRVLKSAECRQSRDLIQLPTMTSPPLQCLCGYRNVGTSCVAAAFCVTSRCCVSRRCECQDLLPILEVAKDVGNLPVLHIATAAASESPEPLKQRGALGT